MAKSIVRQEVSSDIAAATVKSTVALGAVGATLFGFTVQEVTALVGGFFIFCQLCYLAWKWRQEYVDRVAFRKAMMKPADPKE